MSSKNPIKIITLYDDGTYEIQDLHLATTQDLDGDPAGDLGDGSGGDHPTKPPPNP